MSTPNEDTSPIEKKNDRRRPFSNRRRGPRKEKENNEENIDNKQSIKTVRKERPPSLPVPAELIGKKSVGVVTAVIKKGKVKFGFIHIGDGSKPNEEVPKIYFSFSEISDKSLILRRDYIVEFTSKLDEEGRSFASDISLTEEGKRVADEKEAAYAKRVLEKSTEPTKVPSEAPKRERRERPVRQRKQLEPKIVNLLVSIEGKKDEKSLEVDLNQSIGKLKATALALFDASGLYNVFRGEEFLTKAILLTLNNNDKVRLVVAKEESKK